MTADIKLVIANPDITGMPPPAPVILVATQLINLIVSKAQAPTSAVAMVQLAMANINVAPVLRLILGAQMPVLAPPLINMPAPAQVTPKVPALLAMVNILNVLVLPVMNGKMEHVPKPVIHLTNILVPILMKPEGLEIPVIINTNHAPVNLVTSGTTEYA